MSIPDKYIEHKIGTKIDWTKPINQKLINYIRIVGRWRLRANKTCVTPTIEPIDKIFDLNTKLIIKKKYQFYCPNPKDLKTSTCQTLIFQYVHDFLIFA